LPLYSKARFDLAVFCFIVLIICGARARVTAATRMDLDRDWMFRTDPDSIGQRSLWQFRPPEHTLSINLPNSWNPLGVYN